MRSPFMCPLALPVLDLPTCDVNIIDRRLDRHFSTQPLSPAYTFQAPLLAQVRAITQLDDPDYFFKD